MEVKIKKLHPDAVIPTYGTDGSAGMDLTAVSHEIDEYGNRVYHTGIAVEIPRGYVGLIFPRSSICKHSIHLTNAVGVIDSDYRGEITAKFKPTPYFKADIYDFQTFPSQYKEGDRIAQMIIIPYPQIEFKEVDELSDTERGNGGYGSTGR